MATLPRISLLVSGKITMPVYNLFEQGKQLLKYVEREFDEFLHCGRLEHGFLRVLCGNCKHEKLVV